MVLKAGRCPRCDGGIVVREDESVCISCGNVWYLPQQPRKKRKKHKFLTMLRVPYCGNHHNLSGIKAHVYVPVKSSKQDIFYYSVRCPFSGCGIMVDTDKKCSRVPPGSQKGISSYKYICPDGHLWYLVEEKDQPSYWR